MVEAYQLVGEPPAPETLLWDDGATQWSYSKNKFVLLNGKAVQEDDGWYLIRDGSTQSVRLNLDLNPIGTDDLHSNISMTWMGRLRQVEHSSEVALVYTLDGADALDTDGDRVSDSLESANGMNINSPDTDGDGVDDRLELEEDSNPNA